MNEFDHFVKHVLKVKNYVRYTDDFIIVSDDEKYLESILNPIRDFLRSKLHLDLHPKKVTIRKYNRGVDFLGYVILPYHIKLRTKTKHRMIRRLRERVVKYKNGEITESKFQASMKSYLGVMYHANAYELSQDIINMCWFLFTS